MMSQTSLEWVQCMSEKILATPHSVTRSLGAALLRLMLSTRDSREKIEQDGIVAAFLCVTAIEAFTNLFFQIVAEEAEFSHASRRITDDLAKRGMPTGVKILTWTRIAFDRTIQEADPRWLRYQAMRDLRNQLTHFRSLHETVTVPGGVSVQGLADMSAFQALTENTPRDAFVCLCGVLAMVAEARGHAKDRIGNFIHLWLGIPSTYLAELVGRENLNFINLSSE